MLSSRDSNLYKCTQQIEGTQLEVSFAYYNIIFLYSVAVLDNIQWDFSRKEELSHIFSQYSVPDGTKCMQCFFPFSWVPCDTGCNVGQGTPLWCTA